MTEYLCKCGRKLQRSTSGATTGQKLAGYGPGHECFGCPYVVPIKAWADGGMQLDHYECIASKELHYDTYACTSFFENDSKVGHILSLDWDFLRRVADECGKHPNAITINREKDGDLFAYKSKYREDGRFDFCIYPTQNKAGAKAKRAIFEKFFTPSGRRKDMTPEQEKEKILKDIQTGCSNALPRPYNPGDIYIDPLDHSRMRVVDLTPDKKERTWQVQESDGPNDWEPANSSVYPHFEDAVRTLAAFVRSYGLVPEQANTEDDVEPTLPSVCVDCLCWKCGNEECGLQCEHDAHDTAECERNGGVGINCKDYIPKEESACPEPVETALPTVSAPACPAECGTAEPALTAAPPAALAAASTTAMADRPSFDYSGLSRQTIDTMHLAEQEILEAKQIYIVRVSNAVAMVHQELVSNCNEPQHNQHSENTFISWCASVGISKAAAYRFLQVDRLLSGASPEELATLEAASPSLLYAAAKPSAPAELVQAVKDGDITSHKQYQELLAQLKTKEDEVRQLRHDCDYVMAQRDAAEEHARSVEDDLVEMQQQVGHANSRASEARTREEEARAAAHRYHLQAQQAEAQRNACIDREGEHLARIAELEARPIEVTAVDPDELQRRAQTLADRQTTALRRDLDAANRLNQTLSRQLEQLTGDETKRLHILSRQAAAACRNAEAVLAAWLDTLRGEPDEVYKMATTFAAELAQRIGDAVRYGSFEAPATYHQEDHDV